MTWRDHPDAPPPGTELCRLEDLADGAGRPFEFGAGEKPFRLFVVRRGTVVRAYVNACAHFGTRLDQTEGYGFLLPGTDVIECQVHYAKYALEDGRCLKGECGGRGLEPVPLVVSEGTVGIGDPP